MKITVDEARAYFAHPSQHDNGLVEPELSEFMEYWAKDGVCLCFHPAIIPSITVVHIGVKREAWGSTTDPTREILQAYWAEHQPRRIVAWIETKRKHAIALARRVGFIEDGRLPDIIMMGWRP